VTAHYGELIEGASYTPMPWDGFVFNPAPIMEDYTRVAERAWGFFKERSDIALAERPHQAIPVPLLVGMQDNFYGRSDEAILATMPSEMEIAGMPTVLAECRRQYAAYLEKTGWTQP